MLTSKITEISKQNISLTFPYIHIRLYADV